MQTRAPHARPNDPPPLDWDEAVEELARILARSIARRHHAAEVDPPREEPEPCA